MIGWILIVVIKIGVESILNKYRIFDWLFK